VQNKKVFNSPAKNVIIYYAIRKSEFQMKNPR